MTDFTIHRLRADHPDAAKLLSLYFEELRLELGEFDETRSASANPDEMAPPHGVFLVAYDDTLPVACGGLKTLAPGVGEIKRMFVIHEARRHGHGHRLLVALETVARAMGHRRLVLDTAAPLAQASNLYLSSGYQQIDPYNKNPYAARWFSKIF